MSEGISASVKSSPFASAMALIRLQASVSPIILEIYLTRPGGPKYSVHSTWTVPGIIGYIKPLSVAEPLTSIP